MGSGGEGSSGGAASVREPHDFSNVASFSELPFLRSAPPRESPNSGIRIFGIDVPHSSPEGKAAAKETTATTAAATQSSSGGGGAVAAPTDSSRKFECHYCCRHFPTSQALGGHQNAHKRERQHAKRVQMQSAMAAAAAAAAGGAHHHHLLGYPQHRFGVAGPTVATLYPSWPTMRAPGGAVAIGPQFYSGIGSITQPINGNPLTAGLWRGPPAGHGSTSMPPGGERRPVALSVFRGDEPRASTRLLPSPSSSSSLLLFHIFRLLFTEFRSCLYFLTQCKRIPFIKVFNLWPRCLELLSCGQKRIIATDLVSVLRALLDPLAVLAKQLLFYS